MRVLPEKILPCWEFLPDGTPAFLFRPFYLVQGKHISTVDDITSSPRRLNRTRAVPRLDEGQIPDVVLWLGDEDDSLWKVGISELFG